MSKHKHAGRYIAILLLMTMLLPLFSSVFARADTPTAQSGASNTSSARYTQKIVSVLYDNSGSMYSGKRTPAAKYALSMLMSLLSEKDKMTIMPMNDPKDQYPNGIPVPLDNPDRSSVIDSIISRDIMNYQLGYGTPKGSLTEAVDVLTEDGLKDKDLVTSDKEYWFIILTDGEFEGISDPAIQASFVADAIGKYSTLNTVYVSFGSDAVDIIGQDALDGLKIKPYCKVPEVPETGNPVNLVTVMQAIASDISGRYQLEDEHYDADNKVVTIDLSEVPISMNSLSVVAQNCGATIQDNAKYIDASGKEHDVKLSKISTIRPDPALQMENGCSFEASTDTYMHKGSLVLTFSSAVSKDNLSIFAEPALEITHYLEANIDGTWTRVDRQYINANLRVGDEIRVGYEVREKASNAIVDLAAVFEDVTATVTYDPKPGKNPYAIGESIPLVLGGKELLVEVSVMKGAYSLRASEIINVMTDPDEYKVTVSGDTEIEGNNYVASAIFTVYINGSPADDPSDLAGYTITATATRSDGTELFKKKAEPASNGTIPVQFDVDTFASDTYTIRLDVVSPQDLARNASIDIQYTADPSFYRVDVKGDTEIEGASPTASAVFNVVIKNNPATKADLAGYTCTLTATRSDGTVIYEKQVEPDSNGLFPAELKVNTNEFDCYRMTLTVVSPENRTASNYIDVTYVPSSLDLGISGTDKLSITQYNLNHNTEGYVFLLTTNTQPFPITNTVTKYKLLVDGVDVTKYASVSGNKLTYIPTAESLGDLVNDPGNKKVELLITSDSRPALNCSASAILEIVKTTYKVVAIDSGYKDIDRFDLKNSTATLYFSIERDGVPLPIDELKAAFDNGEIKIKSTMMFSFFLYPAAIEKNVEEYNGTAVIAIRSKCDMHPFLDWHLSALLGGGDKPITVIYQDAEGVDSFFVVESDIFQHILRIFLMIFDLVKWALIICYLIGFAIAKPLPKGAFVEILPAKNGRAARGAVTYINVNSRTSFPRFIGHPVFKWHTTIRLNPLKYWKDQPTDQCPICNGMDLYYTDGNLVANITEPNALYEMNDHTNIVDNLKQTILAEYPFDIDINQTIENLFSQHSPEAKEPDTDLIVRPGSVYGYYKSGQGRNRGRHCASVVFFVEF